jgi:hypothetical protein
VQTRLQWASGARADTVAAAALPNFAAAVSREKKIFLTSHRAPFISAIEERVAVFIAGATTNIWNQKASQGGDVLEQ